MLMSDINWDDPAARLDLVERIGVAAYSNAFLAHLAALSRLVVNGRAIRPVSSGFGTLYRIENIGKIFATQAEAEAYARTQPETTPSAITSALTSALPPAP
jgi:hypothetical protein